MTMDDITAAIADLRKVVVDENPNRDRFPVGTAIRWIASERYTYVAVKTGYAWFTTARPGNPFVKSQMNYEELQEVLQRDEVSDIAIATAWSTLDGRPVSTEVPVEPGPLANVNTSVRPAGLYRENAQGF